MANNLLSLVLAPKHTKTRLCARDCPYFTVNTPSNDIANCLLYKTTLFRKSGYRKGHSPCRECIKTEKAKIKALSTETPPILLHIARYRTQTSIRNPAYTYRCSRVCPWLLIEQPWRGMCELYKIELRQRGYYLRGNTLNACACCVADNKKKSITYTAQEYYNKSTSGVV